MPKNDFKCSVIYLILNYIKAYIVHEIYGHFITQITICYKSTLRSKSFVTQINFTI
jgi:hypothetical protein